MPGVGVAEPSGAGCSFNLYNRGLPRLLWLLLLLHGLAWKNCGGGFEGMMGLDRWRRVIGFGVVRKRSNNNSHISGGGGGGVEAGTQARHGGLCL